MVVAEPVDCGAMSAAHPRAWRLTRHSARPLPRTATLPAICAANVALARRPVPNAALTATAAVRATATAIAHESHGHPAKIDTRRPSPVLRATSRP